MVLLILIIMWTAVLLPPYLKDRRSSARPFSLRGSSTPAMSSAQRFLPLQQIGRRPSAPAQGSSVPLTHGASIPIAHGNSMNHSNVVQLRPAPQSAAPAPTAADRFAPASLDESALHQAWEGTSGQRLAGPTSKTQARERRRVVLLSLTGFAVLTLLVALVVPSTLFIAAHIVADLALVGFAILLVRHRQLAAERSERVEPIRPAVSSVQPANMQLAPPYLVSNG